MQYRDPSTGNFKELYFKGGDTLPIGSIIPFGGTLVPTNWLICDGSAVSRTTYADLFAVIGTSFGTGDGSTTFNLPDLRSRVPLGKDSRDTDFDTIGETYGEKAHTLTVAEMPRHSHEIYRTAEGEEWVYTFNTSSARGDYYEYANTGFVGGDGAHNIVQPSLVTNYIIKAFQASGVVGNVTNLKNNSQQDTYSCEYLNQTRNSECSIYGYANDGQTITGETDYQKINYDNANRRGDGISLSNGTITITSDTISRVLISASVSFADWGDRDIWIKIYKNNTIYKSIIVSEQSNVSITSIIPCTKNDTIEIKCYTNTTGALSTDGSYNVISICSI